MDSRYKIGMRNIKTAFAVGFCLIVFQIIGISDGIQASITAIICMKSSYQNSLTTGIERTIGTFIGSVLGILTLLILVESGAKIATLLAIINIVIIIYLCNVFKVQASTIISLVVFLMILLGEKDQPPLIYGTMRLVETIFGILTAYLVNRYFDPRILHNNDNDSYLCPEIRDSGPDDIPSIMGLWLQNNLYWYPHLDPVYWHQLYDTVRERYLHADNVYLYTENENIIGFVAIKDEKTLEGPFVTKATDERKVGMLLLHHCQTHYGVLVSTLPATNEPLRETFFKSGFNVLNKAYDETLEIDVLKVEWSRKNH
jgi:hypothetical protein